MSPVNVQRSTLSGLHSSSIYLVSPSASDGSTQLAILRGNNIVTAVNKYRIYMYINHLNYVK